MHFIFIYLLMNIHTLCHVIKAYAGGPARSTPNQQKPVRNSYKRIYSESTGLLCFSVQ